MTPSYALLPALLLAGCVTNGGVGAAGEAAGMRALRAHGNEPAWSLEIDEALRFESGRLHVQGPATPLSVNGASTRYAAALRDRAIAVTVEVVVIPGLCRDSLSGMPYPLRVELAVDARRFLGCGGEPAALLRGGEWVVTGLAGSPVEPTAATLHFGDDGRLAGRTACNAYRTTYRLTGETLGIGRSATTRMACPPPQMAQEQRFLEILHGVRRFDIGEDGSLLLIDGEGRQIRARR